MKKNKKTWKDLPNYKHKKLYQIIPKSFPEIFKSEKLLQIFQFQEACRNLLILKSF